MSLTDATYVIPSGTVTFLFTDVEGSTRMWAAHPEVMRDALERHDEILRGVIESGGGYVFSTAGDAFSAAFHSPDDALTAAVRAQADLTAEVCPDETPIRVRMGVHVGVAQERGGDYFGPILNLAARVEAAGHGGQVLVTEAVQTEATLAARSLGVHELRDIPDMIEIYQVGEGDFPPLRTVDRVVSTLPSMRSSLIGREADVIHVRKLLADHRVVTVTGVGGCGKTRLAIEVAGREMHSYDGVFFVDLTKIDDDDDVLSAIIGGIGLVLSASEDQRAQLVAYLNRSRTLLLVDNCEHVLDGAAAELDELLSRAADLCVLVTSREALEIEGEYSWRIRSLGTEDRAAVRLFFERASDVEMGFEIDHSDEPIVAEICERLDGIPLAIELAAARTRAMSVSEVRDRLDDRFRLLSGGRRRSRQRQQTLSSIVDWSYGLLDGDEKKMLRRLSVFQGGFELTDVGPVAGFDEYDALDLVESLVAKSLIDIGPGYEGEPRRRLLETIRLFAVERLIEADEAQEVRESHLARFVHSMAHLTALETGLQVEHVSWQLRESANIRSAINWALDSDQVVVAALATSRYATMFGELGLVDEALELLDEADAVVTGEKRPAFLTGFVGLHIAALNLLDVMRIGEEAHEAVKAGAFEPDLLRPAILSLLVKGASDPESALAELDMYRPLIDASPELKGEMYGQWAIACGFVAYAGWGIQECADRLSEGFELADVVSASLVGFEAAQALAITGRHELALATAKAVTNPPAWNDMEELAIAASALGSVRVAETGRILAEVARRKVTGRIVGQEGDYLGLFAHFHMTEGRHERALELADNGLGRQPNPAVFDVAEKLQGWTSENRAEMFGSLVAEISEEGEARRRLANNPDLLAEEIEFWT